MEWLCGLAFGAVAIAISGHLIWLAAAGIIKAILGKSEPPMRPLRPFRYCPACGANTAPDDRDCPQCQLYLDGRLARAIYRIRVAEREVRALVERAQLDPNLADEVLAQLETRSRSLLGLPAKAPRARVVAPATPPPSESAPLGPSDAVELLPERAAEATPANRFEPTIAELAVGRTPPRTASIEEIPPPTPTSPPLPEPPTLEVHPAPLKRKFSSFLEEHNILWGELVGGLLIVGCSIALVVTLRHTLESVPYFRFLLSAAVTLGLFGAGEYTLHRWKLAGTSRGMLVIALLLTPLTLLLLAEPFTQGASGVIDLVVKCAAIVTFVGVVRTGGRDLIGTEHLPGPIDRRWLLSLAVVGTTATQLLPGSISTSWLPLLCFIVACIATLGGLSWYHPGRREEPIAAKSGSALLMFIGLGGFALCAAWGLHLVRAPAETATRLHLLAFPLALASIPVVEAGVLVLRRVEKSSLQTLGTVAALVGFLAMTSSLALAWPNPLLLLPVSALAGGFLTRVAFREQLPWVHAGAIPLLAFAAVLGFHGMAGNWVIPTLANAEMVSRSLARDLSSAASGAALAGVSLLLLGVAEILVRRASFQTGSYLTGAIGVGTAGLLLVSWHGTEQPAIAAFSHLGLAVGLLAGHFRWKRRAVALGGIWLILAGTMWALWWLAPRQLPVWGVVVAVEKLLLAFSAVILRRTHITSTALFRRAAGDVTFTASVLAVGLALISGTAESEWHTGTLFALAFTGFTLARLTDWFVLTWAGSTTGLFALVHGGVFTLDGEPVSLTIETALLLHTTLTTVGAVACRRHARVFGDPLRWSARFSSVLAVPLLFLPPLGLAYLSALLACWLGVVWLAFLVLWRERGAFSAFPAAFTLAALLAAFGWIQQQPWWWATELDFRDPRALQAFGYAVGILSIVWIIGRRAVHFNERAREVWCSNPLSLDRITLGIAVIGFSLVSSFDILPAVEAELTPIDRLSPLHGSPELRHAFTTAAWGLLALFSLAMLLSWRLSKLEWDANVHTIGVAILTLAAPVLWAGAYGGEIAAASALRWGLAVAFVSGSIGIALRTPIRNALAFAGLPVRVSAWLRPWILAIFAGAAGAAALLSALQVELELSQLPPSGPVVTSIFALMGVKASILVPLTLVVVGLSITGLRERLAGYALASGLVFTAAVTTSYALTVTSSGTPLADRDWTIAALFLSASAALWASIWLALEWRIPGGVPLSIQVCLGFGTLGLLSLMPAVRLLATPGDPLPAAFDPLGQFGWGVLVLVSGAGIWHLRRIEHMALPLVFSFAGLTVGVLIAVGVRAFDVPGWWFSFHVLVVEWALVGFAFIGLGKHGNIERGVLTVLASILLLCALRGGWYDPWRPWIPAGLALCSGVFLGATAIRTRAVGFVAASAGAVNVAACFVWLAWGPDSVPAFLLANAVGLAASIATWTLVAIWLRRTSEENWLSGIRIAVLPAIGLLVLGLAPTFAEARASTSFQWGAIVAVAVACAVGLWDRTGEFARPGLYTVCAFAVLLGVVEIDPLPVWNSPLTTLALAGYVVVTAWLAFEISRLSTPFLWMPTRENSWAWLLQAEVIVSAAALLLGLRTELIASSIWERLATPAGVALLAVSFALLARIAKDALRDELRMTTVALAVGTLAALAWAVPAPLNPSVWLDRNGWLFVALVFAALVCSGLAPRTNTNWHWAVRTMAGWAAGIAVGILCVSLLQQVPVFDPKECRTPLSREAAMTMLLGIIGLIVLALRFAIKAERDPFALRESRRTVYVYFAEALLVLMFVHIRFNVPELFLGNVAKYWTFVVMALAYTGIGLAELFERKKVVVLALPLRRTGVLLPLVPLLAFWAKPPVLVSEFARDRAPGLGPLLGYLEKLPQHFDTYAWLWFLAGGVYGLVALSRRSFGWALLAALATNAAMWSLLTYHEVPFILHPQAWVIPLALIVLVSEHINRHRLSAEISSATRYAGISMIYIASAADMFLAGVGNSMWLPVVLAALCVLGVFAGMLLRVRAFLYLGVGFLLLDLFSMIWYAAVDLQQTWVWYASGIVLGVVVLALFAYLEKRRTHAEHGTE